MKVAGLSAVSAAKDDGRWAKAYDSLRDATLPEDFLRELKKDRVAYGFYKTLNRVNTCAITYRLETAKKPETRERWMRRILDMLANGEKFH